MQCLQWRSPQTLPRTLQCTSASRSQRSSMGELYVFAKGKCCVVRAWRLVGRHSFTKMTCTETVQSSTYWYQDNICRVRRRHSTLGLYLDLPHERLCNLVCTRARRHNICPHPSEKSGKERGLDASFWTGWCQKFCKMLTSTDIQPIYEHDSWTSFCDTSKLH